MAGDWIKMRTNLDTHPKVLELACLLHVPELHVVGCLWKVWAWADSHTLDGNGIRVTDVTLDRFTSLTGFSAALRKVGWLEGREGSLSFPRFADHNGQTAKNRAETAERVAKHRNRKSVTDVTEKPLPEKRREEKIKHSLSHHGKIEIPPTWDTQEFHQAVVLWKQDWFDKNGQALGESKLTMQLMELRRIADDWPVEKVIRSIQKAIAVDSKRFFDPDEDRSNRGTAVATSPRKRSSTITPLPE